MKRTLLTFTALACTGVSGLMAQDQMSSFLTTGLSDANKLVNAYGSPLLKSFGAGLNAGWYNTAKPLGLGGFDIRFSSNFTMAPSADQSFDVNSLGLSSQVRLIGTNSTNPTVFGTDDETKTAELGVYGRYPGATQDSLLTKTKLPNGIGLPYFAVPAPQVSVGVGLGTELSIRYFPNMALGGDVKVGLTGFGIKHDIKQWIPVMKNMPFDLAVQAGYNNLEASIALKTLPPPASDNYTYNANPNKSYSQSVNLSSTTFNANILFSKKLSVFTPYIGVGYYQAKSSLSMLGEYAVKEMNANFDPTKVYGSPNYDANDPNSHPTIVRDLKDPIKINGDISGVSATVGFRLKLTVLTIHADYTYATYQVLSAGIGINVQSLAPPKL